MPIAVVCFFHPESRVLIQLCNNFVGSTFEKQIFCFVFFFFCQLFYATHIDNHLQQELAKFGYMLK